MIRTSSESASLSSSELDESEAGFLGFAFEVLLEGFIFCLDFEGTSSSSSDDSNSSSCASPTYFQRSLNSSKINKFVKDTDRY